MELNWLKQFQVDAKYENLTKAAEELFISQPALSKTIRNLEKEFNAPLFDHVGKHIVLNENGKTVLKYSMNIFTELDNLSREIDEKNQRADRTITLSVLAASQLLPDLLGSFRKKDNTVSFQIHHSKGDASDYDLSLMADATPINNNHTITLIKEEILVAVPEDATYISASEDSVSLASLAGHPFISLEAGMGLTTVMNRYCSEAGFEPNVVLRSDNPATLRSMISLGLGIAFVPSMTWSGSLRGVRLLHIRDLECARYLILTWPENRYLSPAAEELKKFIITFFKTSFLP